jgi:hypothetical protein
MMTDCPNCASIGWVCENHRDRPWGDSSVSKDASECGAGASCPVCNVPAEGPARLPPGFTPDRDKDGWRH